MTSIARSTSVLAILGWLSISAAPAAATCALVPTNFVQAGVGKTGALYRYEVALWANSGSPTSATFSISSVNAAPRQVFAPLIVLQKGEGGAYTGKLTFALSARYALGIAVKQVTSKDGTSTSCADAEHRIDGPSGTADFDDITAAAKALSEAKPLIERSNDPSVFDRMIIANYPMSEQASNHQGSALVQVVVGADGTILEASIIRSSGYAGLDRAALDAARSSTYAEPKVLGKPAVGKYKTEYSFNLPLR